MGSEASGGKGSGNGSGDGSANGATNGLNGGTNAGPASGADAPEAETADQEEPAPAEVLELVASCIRIVQAKLGVPLDGTQDTLSLLDAYVQDARKSIEERPETMALVAASVGAYFGEVVRHTFGATWVTVGDHAAWRLCFKHVYLTFNPIGLAIEALTGAEAPGTHAHLEMEREDREQLQRRLAALGQVDEDEYYLPTTRFDVIDIAVAQIAGRMAAQGLNDVTYGPEDYER
jgi:hypothetical protein